MKLYIYDGIKRYISSEPLRFHTPGHKGTLLSEDVTEIDDSFPGDAVQKAQNSVAELFGCKHVRFSVGGSSMAIKAAVLGLGGDILVASNSHQALFEAAELAKVNAFTVECGERADLKLPLTPLQIEKALDEHPSVKAVYITSPDYYGICASNEIAEAVKGRAYLFCDGAHGAHFAIRPDLFPKSFVRLADVINLSAHKTLPAYTQSAYLCVNNDDLIDKIDHAMTLLGTTSPSYLLLGGLEYAAKYSYEHRTEYDRLLGDITKLKAAVPTIDNDDFTRLVVDAKALGLSGSELYHSLKKSGIVAEKFDDRYVIFIISLCDSSQKIQVLKEKLCEVSL